MQDGALTEQRGKTRTAYPLARLTRMTVLPAQPRRPHPSVALRFGVKRIVIPAAGFGPRGVQTQLAAFAAFVRTLAGQAFNASPAARFVLAQGADRRSPLVWAVVMLGTGAAGMLLASISSFTRSIGLSLASHLIFAALLLAAILPWLEAADHRFDPLAIPTAILP